MIEDLKKEIKKVAQGIDLQAFETSKCNRIVVKIPFTDWRKFIEAIQKENILSFNRLRCLTAYNTTSSVEVVAEIQSPYWDYGVSVRTLLNEKQILPSLKKIWKYADWLEKELDETFGIRIEGQTEGVFLMRKVNASFPLKAWLN